MKKQKEIEEIEITIKTVYDRPYHYLIYREVITKNKINLPRKLIAEIFDEELLYLLIKILH